MIFDIWNILIDSSELTVSLKSVRTETEFRFRKLEKVQFMKSATVRLCKNLRAPVRRSLLRMQIRNNVSRKVE